MIRWLSKLLRRDRRLNPDLDRREAVAKAHANMRELAAVKRERRARVHDGLRQASAWRGAGR